MPIGRVGHDARSDVYELFIESINDVWVLFGNIVRHFGDGVFSFSRHFKECNNVSNFKTAFVDSRNHRDVKCKSFKQGQRL